MLMTKRLNSKVLDLDGVNQVAFNKYEEFLNYFNLECRATSKRLYAPCPIHEDADNPNGFSIRLSDGDWACFTHQCHVKYCGKFLGLVRALLSRERGADISIKE